MPTLASLGVEEQSKEQKQKLRGNHSIFMWTLWWRRELKTEYHKGICLEFVLLILRFQWHSAALLDRRLISPELDMRGGKGDNSRQLTIQALSTWFLTNWKQETKGVAVCSSSSRLGMLHSPKGRQGIERNSRNVSGIAIVFRLNTMYWYWVGSWGILAATAQIQ